MQITLASHNDSEKLIKISKAYKATRDKEIQMIDLVNAVLLKKFSILTGWASIVCCGINFFSSLWQIVVNLMRLEVTGLYSSGMGFS